MESSRCKRQHRNNNRWRPVKFSEAAKRLLPRLLSEPSPLSRRHGQAALIGRVLLRGLVNGLARYHTPHAASWVLHIALTTRNEVYVSMANGLSSDVTVVHTNIEAAY